MSYSLPKSIEINGKEYKITNDGDYRMVIDCFKALNDCELSQPFRIITALMIFYVDFNSVDDVNNLSKTDYQKLVEKMFDFFNAGQTATGIQSHYKLIDWDKDEQLICAAVNNVAKTEIRSIEYLHWYTFLGNYMSIGDSVLSMVVSIRDKIVHKKKLEKYELKFRKDNPNYFNWEMRTAEEIAEEKAFMEMWNSGSL